MTNFFQKIIDIIRNKYYYKNHFITACKKRFGIESRLDKISALVLGSSHAYYAFIPDENEFSLAMTSQDMYYSYKLYEKYADKLTDLKNIILFYSVFSPGHELEKTRDNFLCIPYAFNFNIFPKGIFSSVKVEIECLYRYLKFKKYESATKNNLTIEYRGGPQDETDSFKDLPFELRTGGGD